jgi:hypothetical protein
MLQKVAVLLPLLGITGKGLKERSTIHPEAARSPVRVRRQERVRLSNVPIDFAPVRNVLCGERGYSVQAGAHHVGIDLQYDRIEDDPASDWNFFKPELVIVRWKQRRESPGSDATGEIVVLLR